MADQEDKGFTVEDKRYLHMSEEEKARYRQGAGAKAAAAEPEADKAKTQPGEAAASPKDTPMPEISFASFIISLSSTAFSSLGLMPDPHTGKQEKNLPLAKQTIDLLGLLREKTRNNLSSEEDSLFDHLLYDLRMAYIKEAG